MKSKIYLMALLGLVVSFNAFSHDKDSTNGWTSSRPDGHAPIGVMGDHVHNKGEWMISYRYMYMSMAGNRNGTNQLTSMQVRNDYMVSPLSMPMQMHMFGVMYAPLNNLTLMAMLPYIHQTMNHEMMMMPMMKLRTFTTQSSGIGDVKLTGLYNILNKGHSRVHINIGVLFPTGAVDATDDTPMMSDAPLPYPMQLGSGTFGTQYGITYLGQVDKWSWGVQGMTTFRFGKNKYDYRMGNEYSGTTWLAWAPVNSFSYSLRLKSSYQDNYIGADTRLNPMMIPTADTDLRAGFRTDALLGVNFYGRKGFIKGHRLAIEGGLPVYQSLDGPQLEVDWSIHIGYQYAF